MIVLPTLFKMGQKLRFNYQKLRFNYKKMRKLFKIRIALPTWEVNRCSSIRNGG